jgi:hypothetical protein
MGHQWQSLDSVEHNPFGFNWYCPRCGSVSGQKDKPSPEDKLELENGPLDCDGIIVHFVMQS